MAERATEFLINLSTNPRALAAFKADPEAAVAASNLSPAERALVLSGDPVLIQRTLMDDPGLVAAARDSGIARVKDKDDGGGSTVVVVVVVVV